MQIVINLQEDVYKNIMEMRFYFDGTRSGKGVLNKILYAIRTGTPLPEGHGRLIDADKLKSNVGYTGYNYDFQNCIDDAPTIMEVDKVESEGKDER